MSGTSTFLISFVTSVAAATATVYVVTRYELIPPQAPKVARVPDLEGRTLVEATLILEQAGFRLQAGDEVEHETIPAGRVAQQVPVAGSDYGIGRTITVMRSTGPNLSPVPKVVGLSKRRAEKAIVGAGFKLGQIRWRLDDDLRPFVVLQQTPTESEKARPGSTVDIWVNRDDD